MHFLYPGFLFALFTLAIPVIVHLFNFRRYQKVNFSNVQFLKELQEQQSSRRNVKERLILASRLLALTFLVLAFAKPYLPGHNVVNSGKQQAISIFVDNSYSMQTLSREGSLLDEAKHQAKEIAAAYSINDRFQLLTQDFEGKHQRLLNRDEFNDAVDAVKISPQSRSLQQIVARQQSLVNTLPGSTRLAYILSDFQKNMGGGKPLRTDSGMQINLVRLKASTLPNIAVDSVWLLSAVHRPDESEKLVVRLHNYADGKAEKVPLKLIINDEQKALGSFTLNARSVQNDTLAFSGLKAGWQHGQIALQDNPITFDNQFYFTFNVKPQMPLLLINGEAPDQYLNAAFATDAFFKVQNVTDGNVNYAALGSYPLIMMSNVKAVSPGLADQLKTYVAKGGTLAVFPAADADLNSYKAMLQPMHAAYPEKLIIGDFKVAGLNMQSPVFKSMFEHMPENPDLPVVKRFDQLNTTGAGASEGLMTLPGSQPFWSAYNNGRGKVFVSAVPLKEEFSNLPRHALLLPVMFRMALLSGRDQPLFYTLGQDETVETAPVEVSEKQVLKLAKGNISIIPDVRQQENSTYLYIADQLHETGNYELKKKDSTLAVIAFNDNAKESDLSYLDNGQLKILLPNSSALTQVAGASLKGEIADANFGMQLWKLCIILALIGIAAEILLIRFYKINNQPVLTTIT